MAKKWNKKMLENPWAYVKKKYQLNARQIAMAKELGIRPKKFGSMAPNKSEQWKGPLGEFIEECYYKRFKDRDPVLYKPESSQKNQKN
ncbi:MAG: hypothetical protein C5S49_04665 [Candidatus Methanogaster sp.]|nr:MAG: hypothetical protein C5S49_04665 [ANME-2 cluster archaeon]